MSKQSQVQSQAQSTYFNLHVEGVGYLNRVRTVQPKEGSAFLACTVAAMRGSTAHLGYTKFNCTVSSGAEAYKAIKLLERDVADEKPVLIGFRIGDICPETFTYQIGDRKGQQDVSIKGRLLRVKFAKVNGEAVDLPQPAQLSTTEAAAA